MSPATSARPFIRERASGCFWYGKWSRHGQPVIRALGRAWVEPDGSGGWRRKRGRAPQGVLTEAEAAARMLALMRDHDEEQTLLERDAEERPGSPFVVYGRRLARRPDGTVRLYL